MNDFAHNLWAKRCASSAGNLAANTRMYSVNPAVCEEIFLTFYAQDLVPAWARFAGLAALEGLVLAGSAFRGFAAGAFADFAAGVFRARGAFGLDFTAAATSAANTVPAAFADAT